MKYVLLLLLASCGEVKEKEETFRERIVVACLCNNPSSIWHLSECNDECTRIDYTDSARCECITDVQCEENRTGTEFLRRACGFYYR